MWLAGGFGERYSARETRVNECAFMLVEIRGVVWIPGVMTDGEIKDVCVGAPWQTSTDGHLLIHVICTPGQGLQLTGTFVLDTVIVCMCSYLSRVYSGRSHGSVLFRDSSFVVCSSSCIVMCSQPFQQCLLVPLFVVGITLDRIRNNHQTPRESPSVFVLEKLRNILSSLSIRK